MVAIVTGAGLGLERGSGFVLGSRGSLGDPSFGRYGENVTVNAATGNLLINRTDEILIGRGPDSALGRGYNSLGAMNDDNGDNWRLNAQRRVTGLTGTLNNAGSTITRTDWDGSEVAYTWDTTLSAYVSKQGSGAYDKLTFASNVWTWTDGDSQVVETYDDLNGGRITATKNTDNDSLSYTYDGSGRLSTVTTASGEYTTLSWTGSNLTQMVTTLSGGATVTRVRYTYDGSNRLATVTTDLTPGDNSVADGKTVVTTYTYDSTSTRVASISQTGGASLAITYVLVGSDYRVQTLTETSASSVTRVTSFSYDTTNRITTITDPLSQATKLYYDTSNQLTRIELPPAQSGASAQNIYYTYNANGDVLTAQDASGNTVTFEYDASGNVTLQRDQAGNTITRTYGSKNELLTETRYVVADPDGAGAGQPSQPVTSRFAYNSANHLRFVIDAEGEVTEYQYDAYGRRTASIVYRDNAYDISALGTTATLSESTMASWASGLTDRSTVARTDTAYDFRGNVSTVTSYSAATTAGAGDTTKTYTVVTYTYDQFGNLLTRQTSGFTNTEVFTYDGLGRVLTSVDLNGASTSVVFTDSANQTVVTLANGLVRTSTYNLAGELISYAESGAGYTTTTVSYKYDSLGRLRMATDASGRTSYVLYDAVGRKVADVTADGSITEYVYDASNRLIQTIGYATKLNGTQLASLVDGGGNPANVTLASIRPNALAPTVSAVSTAVAYNSTNNPVVLNIAGGATSVAVTSGPANGSVTVTGTTITYTPTSGYSGTDSFQYTATNANGTSAAATASITVNAQVTTPPAPTTAASSQTVTVGSSNNPIALKLSGGAASGITIITNPTNGTVTVNGATVTYTPTAGYTGADSFQYRATNAGGTSATATVSLTVAAASGTEIIPSSFSASSTYPIAYTGLTSTNGMRDGNFTALSSMHGTGNGATEFIRADAGSVQAIRHIQIASAPTSAPGGWGAAYTNGAVIEYSSDGSTWTSAGTVSGVVDGSYSTFNLNGGATVSARYVRLRMSSNWLGLGDFQLYSSTTTEITSVTYAASSSYAIAYTGLTSTNGMRDGVFTALSSMHGTNTQTDANIRADLGTSQSINYIRIASAPTTAPGGWGAQYTNGAIIEYSTNGTSWTSAGTVSGVVDGSYSDFSLGGVSARYVRLRMASGYLGLGDFKVYGGGSAPTVSAISTAVAYNSTANPVVLNITGAATSVAVTSGPTNGTYSISGTTITYTPTAGYSGSDSFQYTATNAAGTSTAATASITVNAQVITLPTPISATSSQTVAVSSSSNPIALGLSGGKASSITITTNPTHGTLNVTGTSVTYTPTAGYTGTDSFQYTATNSSGTSAVAAVSLNVGGTPENLREWRVYDTANRLIEVIDGSGDATVFAYDGMSNLIQTTSYYNAIAAGTVNGFKTTPPTTLQLPTANANDVVVRNFYDKDGRLIGTLDGAGYLAQIVYNEGGQKVETIAFATITTAGLRATGTFAQLLTSVGTSSKDIRTRLFYDGRGLLRYALDANLRPTEFVYDAAGQLIHQTDYAGSIGSTSTYSLAYVAGQITSTGLASNSNNRTGWSVYDAAGRLAYTIDPTGAVTRMTYNGIGQLVKQTRYATVRSTTSDPSLATMDSWATAEAATSGNRISRMVYDLSGKLVYTVDAEGYVTEQRYDADGRTTLQIRYAGVYTVTDSVTQSSLATLIGAIPGTAVQTSFSYDSAGRLSDSYDGLGIQTRFVYDALGRVTDTTVAYGTADAATTHTVYDNAGRVASVTRAYGLAEASTTSYTYDGLGRVLSMTDGRGFTTSYTYDAAGNVLTVTRPLDATYSAVTTNTYDSFGNVISSTDPEGSVSYFTYDLLNRLIWQVDAEGYVTRTVYLATGEVDTVTRYFNKATASGAGTVPTVTANAGEDAVTTFTYDKLGRVTKVTDAMGFYEQYTLNAFGDRTTVRNKLGGNTTNVFDRRGLLTSETLPMNSTLANGTVQASTVTNTFQYDARGNRTQMVEASGLAEARTTNYTYDKLDRLTQTTRNAIAVASSTSLTATGSVTPTETISYDRRGNVIETVDAAGARTLSYYDDLNRLVAQVNALGTLSALSYDQNGNLLSTRIYGDAVTLPGSAGGTPPAPVNGSNYRETTFTYDRANRQVTTTTTSIRTGAWNGTTYATSTGAVTTTNYYDKNGNIVQQTDGRGNDAFLVYDKLGRKVAQVDREKYLTVWTLDADGNVSAETRYATKVAITVVADRPGQTATTVAALQTSAGTNAADRTTNFTYDKNGRRLTEARTGVTAWTINTSNGVLTAASTTATITYTYNGLGEVLSKTEATGDSTTYAYDSMGRQTSMTSSSFTDYTNTSVQRVTNNYYNGLNNLTRTVQAGGTNRVTTFGYNAAGNMTSMVDPNGVTHNYIYDVAGRMVRETRQRSNSAGTALSWEGMTTRYDLLGRVIGQGWSIWSGTAWGTPSEETQLAYNVYGEVTGRGINGTSQETFQYDSNGRVWKSTEGDGTTKLYLYDGNGNRTAVISSSGGALPGGYSWSTITTDQAVNLLTNNGASTIGAITVAGMVVTISVFDKRGQDTQTREPRRETTAIGTYGTITRGRTYNAFGEVTQETDSRGNVTDFSYNTMGKIIQRQSPTVNWTSTTGSTTTTRPTETYYYDLSGRLVGVADANGNQNTRSLLAGTGYEGGEALVVKEFHADGGIYTNGYDVFNDLRKTTNEVGKVETYTYDALGQLTQQVHESRPANSPGNPSGSAVQLTDNYTYDIAGNRLTHWNSQLGSSVKDTTDYDAQGRVTATTDMGGITATYSYVWSSSIATTGLGTFGGWTKTTVSAASKTMTEKTDYFGRTVDKVDYGSHDFDYSFDLAGRLTQRTNGSGEDIDYVWYNTGRLASMTSSSASTGATSAVTSSYQYDVDGNRTYEGYVASGTYTDWYLNIVIPYSITHQNATVAWDAMNRMTSFTDTGTAAPATITWKYDKAGNVRNVNAVHRTLDAQGVVSTTTTTDDYWYLYDAMNRFTTTKGQLSGGVISRGLSGMDIGYDAAGQRTSMAKTMMTSVYDSMFGFTTYTWWEQKELYTYTADGYLAQTNVAAGAASYTINDPTPPAVAAATGSGTQLATMVRDAMGRVTTYTEYQPNGTTVAYSRAATYNNKSEASSDTVTVLRGSDTWVYNTTYYYDHLGNGSGTYQGGVVTKQVVTITKNGVAQTGNNTTNTYVWWDGALQSGSTYVSGATTNTSTFYYNDSGYLQSVYIQDGRPRTVSFISDGNNLILQRDEADNQSTGDPRELYYYFNGMRVGDIGNNGTSDTDYVGSVGAHTVASGTGPFRFGSAYSTQFADFDQSYDPINGLNYQSTSSRYTVQDGDTLESIALQLWGDASFWYMIADANGLSGSDALVAGQTLRIPNKVHNAHNSNDVYKVYDPNEAIGDVSPTAGTPAAKPKGNKCGIFGQILLMVIAVVVTYFTAGALTGPMTAMMGGSAAAGAAAAGAVAGIAGSVVSQAVGLATGIQDKFSFKAVAFAAVAGAVGGGLGPKGLNAFGNLTGSAFVNGAVTGVATNLITQGVAVATGLQHKFDWTGVAAAGIVGGVGGEMADHASFSLGGSQFVDNVANGLVSGMAAGIAGAATRSLIEGTNFGDNIIAVLPDVIGSTVGNAIATEFDQPSFAEYLRESFDRYDDRGKFTGGMQVADLSGTLAGAAKKVEEVVVTAYSETKDFIKRNTSTIANNPFVRSWGEAQARSNGAELEAYQASVRSFQALNHRYQITTRAFGGLQATSGLLQVGTGGALVFGGALTSEIGVGLFGLAGGTLLIGHGYDDWQAGLRTAWYGAPQETATHSALSGLGFSDSWATTIEFGLTLGASAPSFMSKSPRYLAPYLSADTIESGVTANQLAGVGREAIVRGELAVKYPGASIQNEVYLRTGDGVRALDPVTGTARRIDSVVIQNGRAIDSVEVTSLTATKRAQILKETRIRNSGGTFVRDRATGQLIDISQVPTQVIRKP